MQKKPIIIISVLCVISLALGYLSGLKDEESPFNSSGETNAGTQTLPPHPNAVEWNGHWYLLVENTSSWENAKSECEKLGGYLTIIDNESENEFLRNMVLEHKAVSDAVTKYKSHVFLHIGCLRSSEKNGWEWINGKSVDYSNWSPETIVNRNTYGGMALSSVNGYPSVKPGDWVNDHGMGFYVCEWDSTPLTPSGFTDKAPDFLKEGLVAYYPFNGNAKDESGNGNDGLVKGALLVEDRNGKPLKAYSFNGQDSFIDLPASKQINYIHHISVSFWINASEKQPSGQQWSGLITRTDHRHRFSFTTGLYPNLVLGSRVSPQHNVDNKAVIASAKWMHIVFTHDGSGCALFIDGKQKSKITNRAISLVSSDLPVTIGAEGNGNGLIRFFLGCLDDIRIYNRALSDEEVKALYEFEKAE